MGEKYWNWPLLSIVDFLPRLMVGLMFVFRWAKLRVAMLPLVIIFEPLSECMVIGACTAWAVSVLFQWDVLGFYLVHILVWFLLDWILLSVVQVPRQRNDIPQI